MFEIDYFTSSSKKFALHIFGNSKLKNFLFGNVFIGAGSSMTMVTSLCITADLIGTHTENGAFVYSVVTFADKLFNGIAVMVIEEL